MKVGIALPNLGPQATRENILQLATQAEKEDFDSLDNHKNSMAIKTHNQHMQQLLTADFQLLPPTLPLSVGSSNIFSSPTFSLQFLMVCRNPCERLYPKLIFGKSHCEGGRKYCRRCEIYLFHHGKFCPYYAMS